jgi:transposase-like protein
MNISREEAIKLYKKGYNVSDICKALGVSRQRFYVILKKYTNYRKTRRLPIDMYL